MEDPRERWTGWAKAECALATLRNLLRDEEATNTVLVMNQAGGVNTGEYTFQVWERVMTAVGLVREGEVVVRFNPLQLEGHAELLDVRMMALVTTRPHLHAAAVLRW